MTIAALVGVGRMGQAMARGWLDNMQDAGLKGVWLIDPMPNEGAKELAALEGASLNPDVDKPADIVVLAVKPQTFREVASGLSSLIGENTLVVSVMAGISADKISDLTGAKRIIRTMPNTPGALGEGATGYAPSEHCTSADNATVETLLAPLGLVEGPVTEHLLEAVTAVSGCGPAYAFFLAEVMGAMGQELGLPADMSKRLAQQTLVGAGALLAEDGADPTALRKAVTSPNGVTQAALDVLMTAEGLPELMRNAMRAAVRRSAELSKDA